MLSTTHTFYNMCIALVGYNHFQIIVIKYSDIKQMIKKYTPIGLIVLYYWNTAVNVSLDEKNNLGNCADTGGDILR